MNSPALDESNWAGRYLDSIDDLVIVVESGTGMIKSVNDATIRRLQPIGHELVGSYVMKLVFQDDRVQVADTLATLPETIDSHLTLRLNEPRGHSIFDVYLRLLSDDSLVVACREATELQFSRTRLAHLQQLVELTTDILVVTDLDGIIIETNPAACRVHGKTMEELVGQPIHRFIHPEGMDTYRKVPQQLIDGGGRGRWQIPGLRPDGNRIELDCVTIVDFEQGLAYTVERDVTDVVERSRQLEVANQFFTMTSDMMAMVDSDHSIMLANKALVSFAQADRAEALIGQLLADALGCDNALLSDRLDGLRADFVPAKALTLVANRAGERHWLTVALHSDPASSNVYVAIRDVTDQHLLTSQLRRQAETDRLTGLANRSMFETRLTKALEAGESVVVAFLDLDNFKSVNDSLGHATGDELLRVVADRLRGCVRDTDVVARFGGDEFCLLLTDVKGPRNLEAFARVVRDVINEPMTVGQRKLVTSCSLGISINRDAGFTTETLMRHADAAAYKAKESGRNRFVVFDDELDARITSQFDLESQLRHALDHGGLDVDVQGIFTIDRELAGVEALVRWDHPSRGRLAPADFLEVADTAGLMGHLGDQVIMRSFAACEGWLRSHPELSLAINLSPSQLVDSGLAGRLVDSLQRYAVDPKQVILEITEDALAESIDHTAAALHAVRKLGFRLAMDDFGKGASSLGHLRDLPFDVVKIDRGFIDSIGTDPVNTAIVESVIGLANRLGMTVVAEGIETAEHVRVLAELGCHRLQGFFLHRPEPAANATILAQRAVL